MTTENQAPVDVEMRLARNTVARVIYVNKLDRLGADFYRVVEQIKKLVLAKKLQGIADVKQLGDRHQGLRLVIEIKNGFVPEAILEQLYRQTALEDTFGINAVALVDGQPRTLGLKEMLDVFLGHRFDVVRRRSTFRRAKAAELIFGDLWEFDPAPESADPKLADSYDLFIAGEFVAPRAGEYFDSINPATADYLIAAIEQSESQGGDALHS